MTKTRPILFSAPMVNALLSGRKTQTRRIVKGVHRVVTPSDGIERDCIRDVDGLPSRLDLAPKNWGVCPFGVPGDLLWVRETFAIENCREVGPYPMPHSDGRPHRVHDDPDWSEWWEQPHYRASDPAPELAYPDGFDGCRWRPSIFMPRWASRITLRLTEVRLQRLQEITPEDAIAEGLAKLSKDGGQVWKYGIPDRDGLPGNDDHGWHWKQWDQDPIAAFRSLWDSINADRGHGWDTNSWVWALSFQVLPQNVDDVDRGGRG